MVSRREKSVGSLKSFAGQAFQSQQSQSCARPEWNGRSLKDKRFPFLIVDAMQLKIRQKGRVVPQSALTAIGVNEDGYREVLGLIIGDSESEATWSEFFRWLTERGLHGVDLVVSDHHGGLINAVRRHF